MQINLVFAFFRTHRYGFVFLLKDMIKIKILDIIAM